MARTVDAESLALLIADGKAFLVDVREPWEHELVALPESLLIPLGELADRADEVRPPDGATVVAYCHHGVRSLSAVAILEARGIPARSLAGGIDRYALAVDPRLPRY